MIIVSQDKETIVNFETISYIEIKRIDPYYRQYEYTITAYFNNTHKQIGKYKTEERAKKVLQDIILIHRTAIPTGEYTMPEE